MDENDRSRAGHMRGIGIITNELQRIVSLYAGTDIELAVLEKGPATMIRLSATQVGGDLLIDRLIDLAEEMSKQHIFGGYGRIRFEFEAPMTIRSLSRFKSLSNIGDDLLEIGTVRRPGASISRTDLGAPLTTLFLIEADMLVFRHDYLFIDHEFEALH